MSDEENGYLRIDSEGLIDSVCKLPDDVLSVVDNGECDYIRFKDGLFERLTFEAEEGTSGYLAVWIEI